MNLLLKNLNFLICLTGLPASGKSTFAKKLKLVLEKTFDDMVVKIIDPDIIREKFTQDKFEPEKEHLVRDTNLKLIEKELKKGNIVISDDLNYYSSMRHDLKEIAENLNVNLFIVHIATPFETCLKWNESRGHTIQNDVIKKIHEKFDEFGKYSWDLPIATFNPSEILDIDVVIGEFVNDLVERIRFLTQVVKEEFKKENHSNRAIENLEKISRKYIGNLLQNSKFFMYKDKIIKLRKLFVKNNRNKMLKDSEISHLLKIFLEKSLNIEIS